MGLTHPLIFIINSNINKNNIINFNLFLYKKILCEKFFIYKTINKKFIICNILTT